LKQQKLTRTVKPEDANKKWYIVDAKDKVLGRLASEVAKIIRGKNKPEFTPNMDNGDFVIVINAEKVKVTGQRKDLKEYFHYSGYPGGAKFMSFNKAIETKPEFVIRHAVRGMLPKTKLGDSIINHLKVYAGESHPHAVQKPESIL